ncbi:hypothetical protein ACVOMT_13830 [Sphingomonas panni]
MTADQYLYEILERETVDTSTNSPLRQVAVTLMPRLRVWASDLLVGVHPSGSFGLPNVRLGYEPTFARSVISPH